MSEHEVGLEVEVEAEERREKFPEVPLPSLIEALLLASPEPLTSERLMELCRCSEEELKDGITELRESFKEAQRGIEVVTVGGRYQLRTKAIYAPYVRELMTVRPRRLSHAALETLAIVAYQQPIVKSEIEKIRGVDVSPTLKTLLERNIIKVLGYQQTAGQPALYGTTEEFLKIFGLDSLSALPTLRDLKALAREPGEESSEESSEGDSEGMAEQQQAV